MNALTPNTHTLFNISRRQLLSKADHKLTMVLESYDVLGLWSSWVQNFGETANLKWWTLLGHLSITLDVPLGRQSEASITFLNALHFNDFLVKSFDFVLNFFESLSVGTLAVSLEKLDIALREWIALVIFHFFVFFSRRIIFLS